jgi:Domain of unknown function (DUF1992)
MPENEDWPEGRPEQRPKPAVRQDGKAAAAARMAQQQTWVDLQVRQAMERGDFDDLPGAGKPIEGLGGHHDPNWWLKKLVEREHIAVLPPSLALRKEDAELDDALDKLNTEGDVRRHVTDFNERVVAARYRTPEGPPLITMPRDVDSEVAAWRERRTARVAEQRRKARELLASQPRETKRRKRWWRRADSPGTR